jgi:hypothetical protein
MGPSAAAAPSTRLLLVAVVTASVLLCGSAAVAAGPSTPALSVGALEAEHQSVLPPPHSGTGAESHWTPPILAPYDEQGTLFSWRILEPSTGARNVSQIHASLMLTTPGEAPIVCQPPAPSDLSMLCGGGAGAAVQWKPLPARRYTVTLNIVVHAGSGLTMSASARGWFITGPHPDGWGGAEWIGLADPNATNSQFRSVSDIRKLGISSSSDVGQATLFVAGLGGHRSTINGRALDPTSVRGTVTEWSNRTLYFGDDVRMGMTPPAPPSTNPLAIFRHPACTEIIRAVLCLATLRSLLTCEQRWRLARMGW